MFKILEQDTRLTTYTTIFQITGFWPPISENVKRKAYYIYAIIVFNLILGIYIIIQAVDFYMVRGDIELMTADAFLLFTNIVQMIKMWNIMLKQRDILNIINDLNDLIDTQKSAEQIELIRSYTSFGYKQFILYNCLSATAISLWSLNPIVYSTEEQRDLPLNGWYPYDKGQSPYYELTFAHQGIALMIAAVMNGAKDCFTTGLMNQVTCQFIILRHSLMNIGFKLDGTDQKYQECLRELKTNIVHHQKILNIVDEIERCFSFAVLTQFTISLAIICASAFQIMTKTENIINMFAVATYLSIMIYQIFLYCSHGNELIIQSSLVNESAYFCNWYQMPQRFKELLIILMIRCMHPATLTAGGFSILSLNTFTGILKIAYSLLTVLQNVASE